MGEPRRAEARRGALLRFCQGRLPWAAASALLVATLLLPPLRRVLQLEAALKVAHEADTKDLRARDKEHVATAARLRKEVAKLGGDLESQTTLANGLISRIAALEEENKKKAVQHQRERASLESSLSTVIAERAKQVDEFHKLMDIKVSLDAELDHYRCARSPIVVVRGLPNAPPRAPPCLQPSPRRGGEARGHVPQPQGPLGPSLRRRGEAPR